MYKNINIEMKPYSQEMKRKTYQYDIVNVICHHFCLRDYS